MIDSKQHNRTTFLRALIHPEFGEVRRLTQNGTPMLHAHRADGTFIAAHEDNGAMDDVMAIIKGRTPVNERKPLPRSLCFAIARFQVSR